MHRQHNFLTFLLELFVIVNHGKPAILLPFKISGLHSDRNITLTHKRVEHWEFPVMSLLDHQSSLVFVSCCKSNLSYSDVQGLFFTPGFKKHFHCLWHCFEFLNFLFWLGFIRNNFWEIVFQSFSSFSLSHSSTIYFNSCDSKISHLYSETLLFFRLNHLNMHSSEDVPGIRLAISYQTLIF